MNLLIINQPLENRGDEAAHRSLLRALLARLPNANIVVVFIGEDAESVRQMMVLGAKVKYVIIPFRRGASRIPAVAFKWRVRWLVSWLLPAYRQLKAMIDAADYVVNAPGGICMGGFQSWRHIFYLMMAKDCRKPIAYYSRSFGPFREVTKQDRLFKRISLLLLNYFDFLSIRDFKTMEIANQLGLRYVTAIDTAFLDVPNVPIPLDVAAVMGVSGYIVFVPNSLVWHIDYRMADKHKIDEFYLLILSQICLKNPRSKVVMLPQLFNAGTHGDMTYFERLRRQSAYKDRIVVVRDCYSSDIQQAIIAKAEIVVGARYHSVVFAINNRVPFIALSYEHKISGLLSILNLTHRSVDIGLLGNSKFDNMATVQRIINLMEEPFRTDRAFEKAREIACNCFETFAKHINALSNSDSTRHKPDQSVDSKAEEIWRNP